MTERCLACDLIAGRKELPGGRIHQTEHWAIEHCVGPFPPGTLIVKPFRHCLHIWDLSDVEAAELGPLLKKTAGVVRSLVQPDQVYCLLWSHANGVPGHIHYVLQPARNEEWGKDIQREPPRKEDVEPIAEQARKLFAETEC